MLSDGLNKFAGEVACYCTPTRDHSLIGSDQFSGGVGFAKVLAQRFGYEANARSAGGDRLAVFVCFGYKLAGFVQCFERVDAGVAPWNVDGVKQNGRSRQEATVHF